VNYLPSVKVPYRLPKDLKFIYFFEKKIADQETWFLRWSKKVTKQYNKIKEDYWKKNLIKKLGIQKRNLKDTFIEKFSKTRVERLLNEIAVGGMDPKQEELKKNELAQLYTIGYNYKNKHEYLQEKRQRRPARYDIIHINRELMERFVFEDPNLLPKNEKEKYMHYLSLESLVKNRVNWLVDRLLAAKIIKLKHKKKNIEERANDLLKKEKETAIFLRKSKFFSRRVIRYIRKKKKQKKNLLLKIQKAFQFKNKKLKIKKLSLLTKNERETIELKKEHLYKLRKEVKQKTQKKEQLVWG
jgi:hypothetical protein